MKIAVEGCAHGELEKIYECIETLQVREHIKVDLLICCGDFQSVRNGEDMRAMAVPDKYQHMCTFHKYYSGELRAPILTLFIGGNHEASNYLQELPYGGWVAPNIYYLGRAGVVQFGNLRIGGMSGIYKGHDYLQGLWESPPYSQNSLRSVYHVRAFDVFRLTQVKDKVHIMLSHDWPRGITDYGNKENLLKRKPFLREDVEANQLGSVPAERLLHLLKPEYWFAAHLHCQFAAIVNHEEGKETKFLALDKCLPKRRHLQIVEVPSEYDGDKMLKHDAEWLAILKNTNHLLTVKNVDCHMPGPGGNEKYIFTPTKEEKEAIIHIMGDMTISEESFVRTAPVYKPNAPKRPPTDPITNPQTVTLCEKLGIDDPLQVVLARSGRKMRQPYVESVKSPSPPKTFTPIKTKMSLPAPVTPSECDSMEVLQGNSILSLENTSFLSESACSSTADCPTPMSEGPKKTFKRRNLALYTSDADDSVSTTSSSLVESDSPRSSKCFKDN
ncbi:lariat debranching enzyme [Pectinophora gossypiella]|uniref:Lariat debranching enzyme C-terminal domain-containing protein n=1 Tax=Pectinophora gossypiella TaxID=13191 RepID=A0A1E1WKW8_PECGO|nr:lariat debranching enzyme [Pectinophora gossypiella]